MRINDKIDEIQEYISELEEIIPSDFESYQKDHKTKAACERYFEKIIEAIVDLAFLVIKDKGLKTPEEDKQAFDILAQESLISAKLAESLKDAKGMRNIITHEYGSIDDEVVFQAITGEIVDDAKQLLEEINAKHRKAKDG